MAWKLLYKVDNSVVPPENTNWSRWPSESYSRLSHPQIECGKYTRERFIEIQGEHALIFMNHKAPRRPTQPPVRIPYVADNRGVPVIDPVILRDW